LVLTPAIERIDHLQSVYDRRAWLHLLEATSRDYRRVVPCGGVHCACQEPRPKVDEFFAIFIGGTLEYRERKAQRRRCCLIHSQGGEPFSGFVQHILGPADVQPISTQITD
jgi:hypothetical protein